MKVFIVGVTGGVGMRLSDLLLKRGDEVRGLARRTEQVERLRRGGIIATVGDLTDMPETALTEALSGSDVVIFTAGAGDRDAREATTAIDGHGPAKVASAAARAGIRRFYLVSVFPEAGRGRSASADFELYITAKKLAEVDLVTRDLDWVILRPGTLTDGAAVGRVDLGWAKIHGRIDREDVAACLIALIDEPDINRVILELTGGGTPIREAVEWLRARMSCD